MSNDVITYVVPPPASLRRLCHFVVLRLGSHASLFVTSKPGQIISLARESGYKVWGQGTMLRTFNTLLVYGAGDRTTIPAAAFTQQTREVLSKYFNEMYGTNTVLVETEELIDGVE